VDQIPFCVGDQRLDVGIVNSTYAPPEAQIDLLPAGRADVAHARAGDSGSLVGAQIRLIGLSRQREREQRRHAKQFGFQMFSPITHGFTSV
jgi:hypothetical protein